MTGKTAIIILYHATWCAHCTEFMPTWEELKKTKNKNIKYKQYEASEEENQKMLK